MFSDSRHRGPDRRCHARLPDFRPLRALQRDHGREAVRLVVGEGGRQGQDALQALPAAVAHHCQGMIFLVLLCMDNMLSCPFEQKKIKRSEDETHE